MSNPLFKKEEKGEPVMPEPHDIKLRHNLSEKLATLLSKKKEEILVTIRVGERGSSHHFAFSAILLLQQILTLMDRECCNFDTYPCKSHNTTSCRFVKCI